MKMLLSSLILLSGLSFATAACSPTEESVNTEEPTPTPEPTPKPQPGNGRTLVVYFSCTVTNMKNLGQNIAWLLNHFK